MDKVRESYFYEAIITPHEQGMYDAYLPDFDRCTCGEGLAGAALMAQDLLTILICDEIEAGNMIPLVGSFDHECPEGSMRIGIVSYGDPDLVFEDTMSVQDACITLDVTRSRIYALIKRGVLRTKKVGNERRVWAQDVIDYCNSPRNPGPAEEGAHRGCFRRSTGIGECKLKEEFSRPSFACIGDGRIAGFRMTLLA